MRHTKFFGRMRNYTIDEVEQMINNFRESYPELERWRKQLKEKVMTEKELRRVKARVATIKSLSGHIQRQLGDFEKYLDDVQVQPEPSPFPPDTIVQYRGGFGARYIVLRAEDYSPGNSNSVPKDKVIIQHLGKGTVYFAEPSKLTVWNNGD